MNGKANQAEHTMLEAHDDRNLRQVERTRAIELLQERRTALISAAVTGKIDVREFATEVVA